MQEKNDEIIQSFEMYPEARNHYISNINKKNIGNLIKTQGMITFADNVNPIAIKKVYICKTCQRLHKITERDPRDEVPKRCIKCASSLKPFDFRQYEDTQLLTLQDIFDSNRNEIFAYTLGDEAYYGRYREGDYVNIIAKVDTIQLKMRNRLIVKIEEIKSKNITIDKKTAKENLETQTHRSTESQKNQRICTMENECT